jgi:hypothetical protein
MKTKFEIFTRNDYSTATSKLVSAVAEIAEKIRLKMYELDLDDMWIKNRSLSIKRCKASANCGYTYNYLGIENGYGFDSLEDSHNYYYCGDFNCRITSASNKNVISFANAVPEILEILNEIETNQTKEAQAPTFFSFYEDWKNFEATKKEAANLEKETGTL